VRRQRVDARPRVLLLAPDRPAHRVRLA
jgi:hypothetical protein